MIDLSTLIADSLYQVNLVLLMLQPSVNCPVKPLLQESGFTLASLEQPLPLPIPLRSQLLTDGVKVCDPVTPDIIIQDNHKVYVIIECKKSMFGSVPQPGKKDGHIRQARSCLLQTPEVLVTGLSLQDEEVKFSSLLYLACHDPRHKQTEGLNEISNELKDLDYETINFGLLGLSHDDKNIYLNGGYVPSFLPLNIAALFKESKIVVHEIDDPENDPRTYYHIPWIPQSSDAKDKDKYSEKVFASAILQQTTIEIAKSKPPEKVYLNLESLINLATNGFYQKWKDKEVRAQLRHNTLKLLRKVLDTARSKPELNYLSAEKALELDIADELSQSQIIEAIRKWETGEWLYNQQPVLFPLT